MSEKVKLPKDVCDALKAVKTVHENSTIIYRHLENSWHSKYDCLNEVDTDLLMRALVLGYETELSPSEKLHELFNDPPIHDRWEVDEAYRKGITDALDTLGIRLDWSGDPNE